jgi:hypothetical protein
MEVDIVFLATNLLLHIDKTIGSKIKHGNERRTMQDEKKLKNRTLNTIKLSNG